MSDITVINDSEQSSLVTNGLAKNGEMYLKKEGSTDAGSIVVYDSGVWKGFANDASASFSNEYSLSLDGTNDYATMGSTYSSISGNKSISGWFRFNNVSQNSVTSTTANQYGWLFWSSNTIFFRTGGAQSFALSTTLATNTWYHVAFTGDGTSLKCYINGTQEGGTKTDGNWSIGQFFRGGSSFYFDGDVDEIGLWTGTTLSSSDITSIYNSGGDAGDKAIDLSSISGLTHWWRFGDGDSSPTVSDNVGSNDLTLVNGPTFLNETP